MHSTENGDALLSQPTDFVLSPRVAILIARAVCVLRCYHAALIKACLSSNDLQNSAVQQQCSLRPSQRIPLDYPLACRNPLEHPNTDWERRIPIMISAVLLLRTMIVTLPHDERQSIEKNPRRRDDDAATMTRRRCDDNDTTTMWRRCGNDDAATMTRRRCDDDDTTTTRRQCGDDDATTTRRRRHDNAATRTRPRCGNDDTTTVRQ